MVSLIVHAILGIAVIAFIVKSNPAIFKRVPTGPQLSALEIVFYVVGIASTPHWAGTSTSTTCRSTRT